MPQQPNKYRKPIVAVFFLSYLLLGLWIVPDYSLSWDEATQRAHGMRAFDFVNEKLHLGFEKFLPNSPLMKHPARNYGLWFTTACLGLEHLFGLEKDFHGRYLMRHVLVFLLFWWSVFFFYKLIQLRWKDWKMGLLGASMLILSPRIFAHSFYNPKDIVFLATYLFATFTMIRFLQVKTVKYALLHALACAFAVDTRIAGILLLPLTFGFLFIELTQTHFSKILLKKLGPSLPVFVVVAAALIVLLSPAYWVNPFRQIEESFQVMSHYSWPGSVLYRGEFIKATALPWHYIPSWIMLTTPLVYLFLLALGGTMIAVKFFRSLRQLKIYRSEGERIDLIFLALFLLPVLAVIVKKSTLYDGWRQLFFIYPALLGVALTGFGNTWNYLEKRRSKSSLIIEKGVLIGILAFGTGRTAMKMIAQHPHQNVFFNCLAGKNLSERFDQDYWGLSYKQAIEELARRFPKGCVSLKAANYPGEENWRFVKKKYYSDIDVKYGPEPAEFFMTNYRNPKELQRLKNAVPPFVEEVFSIETAGNKIMGVYRNPDYFKGQ